MRSSGPVLVPRETHEEAIREVSKVQVAHGRKTAIFADGANLDEMLALHRGRLITRSQIYDHIFGEDDDSLSNLIDVHVSHIRKKLGANFISTRRGLGYIIDG